MEAKKEYTNGEVTIVWKPRTCIHSGICVKGLPEVFKPREKPWVKIDAAASEELIKQVEECPSGALSYYMNEDGKPLQKESVSNIRIEVLPDGPLLVHGALEVCLKDGNTENKIKATAFCRCGHSDNKPYCDGAHRKHNFTG